MYESEDDEQAAPKRRDLTHSANISSSSANDDIDNDKNISNDAGDPSPTLDDDLLKDADWAGHYYAMVIEDWESEQTAAIKNKWWVRAEHCQKMIDAWNEKYTKFEKDAAEAEQLRRLAAST